MQQQDVPPPLKVEGGLHLPSGVQGIRTKYMFPQGVLSWNKTWNH